MFDILYFVFENCQQAEVAQDSERVAKRLLDAGFDDSDISEALSWLAGVVNSSQQQCAPLPDVNPSQRVFAPKELVKLDAACRGFLLYLEQSRVLLPPSRELVIERTLAATGGPLTLDQLKLIVLMVLWNEQTPTSRLIAEDLICAGGERLPS